MSWTQRSRNSKKQLAIKSEQATELGDPETKRRKLERFKDKFQSQINKLNKELEFYEEA